MYPLRRLQAFLYLDFIEPWEDSTNTQPSWLVHDNRIIPGVRVSVIQFVALQCYVTSPYVVNES